MFVAKYTNGAEVVILRNSYVEAVEEAREEQVNQGASLVNVVDVRMVVY